MNLLPPKHQLSKTTFMYGVQCAKRVWLNKHLPKERDVQTATQTRIFQQGTDLGLLAQQLFPGGINAEPENYYSFQQSVADTERYIRRGHQIIYEAAFQFEGILCAVDILLKVRSKWYAYEVKSTNGVKDAHIFDAALQYYVITNAGIDLEDFSIIHLNKQYIRQGDLDIQQLFQPVSVLEKVQQLTPFISQKSGELLEVLSKNYPPDILVGSHCNHPYPCDFQSFCNPGLFSVAKRMEPDLKNKINGNLWKENVEFPVCYLSMQTWSSAIPLFDGHFPYKQVCFQFSIHKQDAPEASFQQVYFLEEEMNSQQEILIEKLIEAAGEKGSIIVHNGSFMKYHLQEFKKSFLALDKSISGLQKRILELPEPFWVDFNPEEIVRESSITPGASMDEKDSGGYSISDRSSASAVYFNLQNEKENNTLLEVRKGLKDYGERSSLDLAKLVHYLLCHSI